MLTSEDEGRDHEPWDYIRFNSDNLWSLPCEKYPLCDQCAHTTSYWEQTPGWRENPAYHISEPHDLQQNFHSMSCKRYFLVFVSINEPYTIIVEALKGSSAIKTVSINPKVKLTW